MTFLKEFDLCDPLNIGQVCLKPNHTDPWWKKSFFGGAGGKGMFIITFPTLVRLLHY